MPTAQTSNPARAAAAAALALALIAGAGPATAAGPLAAPDTATARPGATDRLAWQSAAACVAVAFRDHGHGPRIRGTRAIGEAHGIRHACHRALRRCYGRLAGVPHGPRAVCRVIRAS